MITGRVRALGVVGRHRLVQLALQLLQLPDPRLGDLVLVRHQLTVEVQREQGEYADDGHEQRRGRPGCLLREIEELDPAEEGDLHHEEHQTDHGGEHPGHLDVDVHLGVRRLGDGRDGVHAGDGLDVRQDAGGDHQSKHVDGHQQGGAHGERHQQAGGDGDVLVQLHLHHRHLQHRPGHRGEGGGRVTVSTGIHRGGRRSVREAG